MWEDLSALSKAKSASFELQEVLQWAFNGDQYWGLDGVDTEDAEQNTVRKGHSTGLKRAREESWGSEEHISAFYSRTNV